MGMNGVRGGIMKGEENGGGKCMGKVNGSG